MKENNTVKGTELLFFEKAEVDKIKGNSTAFASAGSLSVLYFSDYSRYILQINDWRYPLLRRLPILAEKNEMGGRSYMMPGQNGFFYRLRIEGASNEGLANFETILKNNSNFSMKGQESAFNKLEASPDDKLMRSAKKETSFMTKASETVKLAGEKAKIAGKTLKEGTKNMDSRKKMMNLKDIKTKNFRKEAKSTFQKDFFTSSEKLSTEFFKMRRENGNMNQMKDFKELAKFTGPSLYLPKEEIEEAILNHKDLAGKGNFNMGMTMPMPEQKRSGFIESVKQGFNELKQGLTQTMQGRERRPEPQVEKVAGVEGMTHYQG